MDIFYSDTAEKGAKTNPQSQNSPKKLQIRMKKP